MAYLFVSQRPWWSGDDRVPESQFHTSSEVQFPAFCVWLQPGHGTNEEDTLGCFSLSFLSWDFAKARTQKQSLFQSRLGLPREISFRWDLQKELGDASDLDELLALFPVYGSISKVVFYRKIGACWGLGLPGHCTFSASQWGMKATLCVSRGMPINVMVSHPGGVLRQSPWFKL